MPLIARLLAAGLFCLGFGARAETALPAFYQGLAALPKEGRLGQVVKQEAIHTSIPGAEAWRIAYVSSDVGERRTLSTAIVVAPAGPAPSGGRPILAWAHGTTGTAQNCGPSQVPSPAEPLNQYFLPSGNSWTDYGLPNLEPFLREGYVLVATDYQGLGAGGDHQYAVAATQGRDVINSVRAVRAMRGAGVGRKAVVYGWSQGGGAVLAAASLGDYIAHPGSAADGIEFVGFVALAPHDVAVMAAGKPLDADGAAKLMDGLAASFSDSLFNFTHFTMTLWGTRAAYPALKLTDLLTEAGAQALGTIYRNKCIHVAADTITYAYGAEYKTMLSPQPRNAEAWARALVEGSVAPVRPVAPVIIYWGTKDIVVPPVMGQLYQAQMCKLGGNVTRVQLPGEQTHFSTPGAAGPLYPAWVRDRLNGLPAPNGCPQG
jgi:pimeloyl-ACP methyl ester carboxylesterase